MAPVSHPPKGWLIPTQGFHDSSIRFLRDRPPPGPIFARFFILALLFPFPVAAPLPTPFLPFCLELWMGPMEYKPDDFSLGLVCVFHGALPGLGKDTLLTDEMGWKMRSSIEMKLD
ncbi:hypothetical protein ASPACDRAFT_115435 [Aspergillus aculeatus ATCC 16872]|uniref:Uncharacterized protein n=1 Tax=Aspergillus aculeatus (strain ATCC 16872 / CBS 172.66 / WB 5094) TaxID=690307 RepID=A0A1L9X1V5_ASPA1|nr:uncharacterized protein ASPACDRAFT_115435 [Aspergillus aculeatus ATCC 16872]OJK02472.1 hypothetical protein ASPACDRAFT_115435 [Aspergillus aculeatus ATCC 16872]